MSADASASRAAPAVALLYPGDRAARERADPAESRFATLFEALVAAGLRAEVAVYHDDFADAVAAQLRGVQAVLVWCNPIQDGRRRDRLDALLGETADAGVLVSAHPQTIARLGTKDVLFETRDLPFGSDVRRIDSPAQLAAELPARLAGGARVLKQHRGHSGSGIWRVESAGEGALGGLMKVRHAERGSVDLLLDMAGLAARVAPGFEPGAGGHLIDQAWQPGIVDGMVRAYLVEDRVAGFGCQALNALLPAPPGAVAPQPGPRLYHGPELAALQPLRRQLESQWIELLRERVGVARERLPLLWDCDFIPAGIAPDGAARYVLCEINVSSVSPFPPSAIGPLVQAVQRRLSGAGR